MSAPLRKIPTRRLGANGPTVSAVGLGAMTIGSSYIKTDKEAAFKALTYAADRGMTFWDCADIYGTTELDLANAPRGPQRADRSCPRDAERALRDGRDQVDRSQRVHSIHTLKRARTVKGVGERVVAAQMEFSPFSMNIEKNGFAPVAKEEGVAIVAYSPLGRGMISGRFRSRADFDANDTRLRYPRFSEENFLKNLVLTDKVQIIADKYDATPSQDTLALILAEDENYRQSFMSTSKWIDEVRSERGNDVIIVLVGNKADLSDKRQVTLEEATQRSEELDILFMETSAKAGHNVKSLFKKIAMSLPGMEKEGQSAEAQNNKVDVTKPSENEVPEASSCQC
ncbi:hypothetical protein EW145_g285 [Phellinidium pouzarii]|uniref:NADP-dependent oxidoreductase domain-containing protein n=1 Tax=Phellinidium pouzarii TaxID=167371 RepID=A0A4S4LPK1_9AGAM|nr:hypothetical protein EW145_g285 [Phellinidium pouzarii]